MSLCDSCIHQKVCRWEVPNDTSCNDYIVNGLVEQYEELREDFVDFVCSGVHNPAPYCKNSCDECVDSYGYCTYRRCIGFNPDGRKYND